MICFLLPYETADGSTNMALDESMLEEAARGDAAYLRCYGWTTPTLSLGYFQRMAEVRFDPRWEAVSIVRRPTGGGAIWHHYELTYAIAVPPDSPLVRPSTALYRAVHGAIEGWLVEFGIPAHRRGRQAAADPPGAERPLLCFTGRDPEDIVSEGSKLVGSAQRRRGGAVLQHGSVLLARSPGVPELLGVCDVAEISMSTEDCAEQLERRIPAALGMRAVDVGWPDRLRVRALELERSTYRSAAWTEAR